MIGSQYLSERDRHTLRVVVAALADCGLEAALAGSACNSASYRDIDLHLTSSTLTPWRGFDPALERLADAGRIDVIDRTEQRAISYIGEVVVGRCQVRLNGSLLDLNYVGARASPRSLPTEPR